MSSFFTILLIGISLSMDAFSLALVYGIIGMKKEEKIILSLIVGIYHFIMPLIGLYFGTLIDEISFINLHIISSIILLYIGIDLIISNYKEENNLTVSILGFIMFGLSVSIDSLTVGIGFPFGRSSAVLDGGNDRGGSGQYHPRSALHFRHGNGCPGRCFGDCHQSGSCRRLAVHKIHE